MKMILVVAFAALALSGCTKEAKNAAACSAAKGAGSVVAAAIGNQLACKNLDAMKADIDAQIAKTKVCEVSAPAGSTIGAVACPIVVEALMGSAVAQIPSSWECTGGVPADKLKTLISDACTKAL